MPSLYDSVHDYVIIGGGIAGTTCIETLINILSSQSNDENLPPTSKPLLISPDKLKSLKLKIAHSELLKEYDILEDDTKIGEYSQGDHFHYVKNKVSFIDGQAKNIYLESDPTLSISYKKCCIATGATPKKLPQKLKTETFYLRDIDSVNKITQKLKSVDKSLAIVGSGGIAFDLVHEFKKNLSVERLLWFYDPEKTANKYFDEVALKFLLDQPIQSNCSNSDSHTSDYHSIIPYSDSDGVPAQTINHHNISIFTRHPEKLQDPDSKMALGGTDWKKLLIKGKNSLKTCELILIDQPVSQELLDKYQCQMACVAIGVEEFGSQLLKGQGTHNNLVVNDNMRLVSNQKDYPDIFAAGDCCTLDWPLEDTPYFYQMQLWSQAKLLGSWAAACMVEKQPYLDFAFNTFAHISRVFGYRIIYLGLYRERGSSEQPVKFLYRVTKGDEYIKVIIKSGRVIGAVLIGETDMEEVFENLIQNELNISMLEDDLLNPDIDLDHYFD